MNPEIVEFLTDAFNAQPVKPELPTYADAASFIAGITFATQIVNYSVARANKEVAFKALTTTTLAETHEAFLEGQAIKIATAENVRSGLVKGLSLFPAAIERVETIKAELPSDALLN